MTRMELLRLCMWGLAIFVFGVNISLAYPLCTNLQAPSLVSGKLSFCTDPKYAANGCCAPNDDKAIQRTFKALNITNHQCAAVVKQILCSQCDAYSATLYGDVTGDRRSIPYLCTSNTTTTLNSTLGQGYCNDVWQACVNATIQNSPFSGQLQPGASPPTSSFAEILTYNNGSLGSIFSSEADFCAGFGPSNVTADYCFSGGPFELPDIPSNSSAPTDVCIEKVGDDVFLTLVPHPAGSNLVALSDQAGSIWLATVSEPGKSLDYDISKPFLNISARVTNEDELGFLGFAFHPNFSENGRFFVSYNCDKQQWADCGGTCACNDDTNCNPSNLLNGQGGGGDDVDACRYSSIIAEYTVNSSSGPQTPPLLAVVANPVEVRRVFTMSLPYTNHHGGQIIFGPLDNYLYFMIGDGGSEGDPFNFAQNPKSLLGKILRLDVDSLPSESNPLSQNLWGAYSIPDTNPFVGQNGSQPEIWALGLRNPWRCSFDSQYPTYFYCGDVGQDLVEEVDLISKGGNYGWRVYEGNLTYQPLISPGGNTSAASIQPIFPILEYFHVTYPQKLPAAVTGGYVSHSREDPCLYGRYVYGDVYGPLYSAAEVPKFSGNYQTQQLTYQCSPDSPMKCSYSDANNSQVNIQNIFSFGVDSTENLYILAGNGVYRVVDPNTCNIVCNEVLPAQPPGSPFSPGGGSPLPSSPSSSPTPSENGVEDSRYISRCNLLVAAILTFGLLAIFS